MQHICSLANMYVELISCSSSHFTTKQESQSRTIRRATITYSFFYDRDDDDDRGGSHKTRFCVVYEAIYSRIMFAMSRRAQFVMCVLCGAVLVQNVTDEVILLGICSLRGAIVASTMGSCVVCGVILS